MIVSEEIENAISTHTTWLKNIKTAVAVSAMNEKNSSSEQGTKTITKIDADNKCTFGKWLYETIDPKLKSNIYYEKTVTLHAQFHHQAANILSLALKGKKSQASSLISGNSAFIQCSEELIAILESWKNDL